MKDRRAPPSVAELASASRTEPGQPLPIVPGLYAALTTSLGTFANVDTVRVELQDGAVGCFVHRVGQDAAVLARGFGVFRGRERTALLSQIPPPTQLSGPEDAAAYAARLAERIASERWDLMVSLALLRATPQGLCGWIAGGVFVFAIDGVGPAQAEPRLCSPPQTLQVPPGFVLGGGLDPARLLVSGVTGTVAGGDWMTATGRRFAIVLVPPPFALSAAAIGDVDVTLPQQLLQRLGAAAAPAEISLVADFAVPPLPAPADQLASVRSLQSGPLLPPPQRLSDLFRPERGLAAQHIQQLDELPFFAAAPDTTSAQIADHSLHCAESFAAVCALSGSRIGRLFFADCRHQLDHVRRQARRGSLSAGHSDSILLALGLHFVAQASGADFALPIDSLPTAAVLQQRAFAMRRGQRDYTAALLCLLRDQPALLPNFIGASRRRRFVPAQVYGDSAEALIHYLATALQADLEAPIIRAGITPAWREFLTAFPLRLSSQQLSWTDLILTALLVYHRIGEHEAATVIDHLHSELKTLSDNEPTTGDRSRPLPAFVRRYERQGDAHLFTIAAGTQRNSGGLARFSLRFVADASADGLVIENRLLDDVLPPYLRTALHHGLSTAAEQAGLRGFRAEILEVRVHPIDATVEKFRSAGALAIQVLRQVAPSC